MFGAVFRSLRADRQVIKEAPMKERAPTLTIGMKQARPRKDPDKVIIPTNMMAFFGVWWIASTSLKHPGIRPPLPPAKSSLVPPKKHPFKEVINPKNPVRRTILPVHSYPNAARKTSADGISRWIASFHGIQRDNASIVTT